ncbi:hypothetical protein [Segatella baroniae]|uniref:hypothetical protein n=1 Tax=Segatella baroniae TaxID=305719 RepID=UPI0012B52279|nr:hypothetical protein [Segatella baroniae]
MKIKITDCGPSLVIFQDMYGPVGVSERLCKSLPRALSPEDGWPSDDNSAVSSVFATACKSVVCMRVAACHAVSFARFLPFGTLFMAFQARESSPLTMQKQPFDNVKKQQSEVQRTAI